MSFEMLDKLLAGRLAGCYGPHLTPHPSPTSDLQPQEAGPVHSFDSLYYSFISNAYLFPYLKSLYRLPPATWVFCAQSSDGLNVEGQ